MLLSRRIALLTAFLDLLPIKEVVSIENDAGLCQWQCAFLPARIVYTCIASLVKDDH